MISLENGMILTHLQQLLRNVGDLGKIIVATSFEWLPKAQKIAQSDPTENNLFFKMGQSRPLFVYFRPFLITNFNNTNLKKCRWCAWDSNPEQQDGRHRRNHGAMAATPPPKKGHCLTPCFRIRG